jgi:putative methyltransferase (TIGR04325 family)
LNIAGLDHLFGILKDHRAVRRIYSLFTSHPLQNERQIGHGLFKTIEEARKAIPAGTKIGFNHPEMAAYCSGMMNISLPSDYASMFWLSSLMREDLRILELGGNIGITYYSFGRVMTWPKGLTWRICDLPEINRAGTAIAQEKGITALSFADKIDEAEEADIFLSFGTLQYLETDLATILATMRKMPAHLIINRTPLTEGSAYVTLQHLGAVVCVYRIFNRNIFINSLSELGYRIVDGWESPETSCHVRYHPETLVHPYSGLYLKLDPETKQIYGV